MSFLDGESASGAGSDLSNVFDGLQAKTASLTAGANSLANAMTRAFTQASAGGKQLDSVLQTLALRISALALTQAFKPLAAGLSGGLSSLFSGWFGGGGDIVAAKMGAIKPFAAGGVIGTPTYFPLTGGGMGLAGEAGPEAIVPLARGADGRLGISMSGPGQPANISVQIATPDVGSFRRSEAYLTGQIARAVARGQRGM